MKGRQIFEASTVSPHRITEETNPHPRNLTFPFHPIIPINPRGLEYLYFRTCNSTYLHSFPPFCSITKSADRPSIRPICATSKLSSPRGGGDNGSRTRTIVPIAKCPNCHIKHYTSNSNHSIGIVNNPIKAPLLLPSIFYYCTG